MNLTRLIAASSLLLLGACGSTPKAELKLFSEPSDARVSISLRGHRSTRAKVGPIGGSVKSGAIEEEFKWIGNTPTEFRTSLKETQTDATVLGIGGKVYRIYDSAVVRFERDGYLPLEKFVQLEKGRNEVGVELVPDPAAAGTD